METWRWIDTGFETGAMQMAIDWVLLDKVQSTGIPVMRIYRWDPFCISMGHNQALSHIDLDRCRADNVHVVRRPTGGRAVFHAREVTYSVMVPGSSPYARESVQEFYMRVSRGLAHGIQTLGVPAALEKRGLDLRKHYKKSALAASCFSAAARYEVVVEGRKLIGSAQRRIRGGLLQHGSIITGDEHLNLPWYLNSGSDKEREEMRRQIAELTVSVGSYLGREAPYREVGQAVQQGVARELVIAFEHQPLSPEERGEAVQLLPEFSVQG